MKRLLKEPLVHFLVLGALFFLVFDVVNQDEEEAEVVSREAGPRFISKEITVSTELIDSFDARFQKTWQRSPSEGEIKGIVDAYVKEEIMYREALALELDKDDSVVRRRMRQKLEFFTQDVAVINEPTDEELTEYLTSNQDRFRLDPVLSFKQVFINESTRPETIEAESESLLKQLRADGEDANINDAGDPLMLRQEFESVSLHEVERQFGKEFRAGVNEIQPGEWEGPVRSGYGIHLVFVSKRIEGRLPTLDEVRDEVLREVIAERRKQVNKAIYEKMRAAYTVTVEEMATQ